MLGASTDDAPIYHLEISVMKEMGWSYGEMCAAPADLVDAVLENMSARNYWTNKRDERDRANRK